MGGAAGEGTCATPGASAGARGVSSSDTVAQALSVPTIKANKTLRPFRRSQTEPSAMTLLLLEALGALLIFIFIVWWTMFSGRKKGELPDEAEQEKRRKAPPPEPPTPD
jgi:hypothetical protein